MRLDDPLWALVDAPALVRELYGARAAHEAQPSAVELQVLVWLGERPEDRLEDVAARLVLSRSTVSHALRRLSELGFIEERDSAADARRRSRRLTTKGKRRVQELMARALELSRPTG